MPEPPTSDRGRPGDVPDEDPPTAADAVRRTDGGSVDFDTSSTGTVVRLLLPAVDH